MQPDAVQHFFQNRQRFRVTGHLTFVQEQQVNVAVRIQFAAAVAAEGHDRDGRKLLARLGRECVHGRGPQRADDAVNAAADRAWQTSRPPPPFWCASLTRCIACLMKGAKARQLLAQPARPGGSDNRSAASASIFFSKSCTGAQVAGKVRGKQAGGEAQPEPSRTG